MKKNFLSVIVVLAICSCGCYKNPFAHPVKDNPDHPLKPGMQAIVDKYISQGIPGIQVVVRDKNGWLNASGWNNSYAGNRAISPDSTTWIFSITKTYTATLILKLNEAGKIKLDSPILKYLPQNISANIKNSGSITVRMLLNHSSGLVNFIELDAFRERQFTDPLHQPAVAEILEMIYPEDPMFAPGTQTYYSNTNYLLLGVLLQTITGKTYESLLQSQLIAPLHLQHTFFNLAETNLASLSFPAYYFDPNSDGQLHECSAWNNALGNASNAWGGIAARPSDVILYYEALTTGRVLSAASYAAMQQYKNEYGLGIESFQFREGSAIQFGHEGDGIGNSTTILYIPSSGRYLFINCTVGRQVPGPYLDKIIQLKNELCSYAAGRN